MIQQLALPRIWKQCAKPGTEKAALPLIISIWTLSYLAIDLIMWAGGRSTLFSNVIISLPMMMTAPILTMGLERLRRQLLHLTPSVITAILLPFAFGAAAVQVTIDYSSVRMAAALLFPEWQHYVPTEHRQFGFGIYVYAVHFLCCLLALTLLQARQSVEVAVNRQREAVTAHRRAEARALRLQLNPHFLFNALNSIAALVAMGGNRVADAMICRLSDFLRASVVNDLENDISLSSEIATTEAYLAIEQLRLGERLKVELHVAPGAWDAAIPPLILQPLAENAVKHGLSASKSAIRLIIDVQRTEHILTISVIDRRTSGNAASPSARVAGAGIGLSNIRQRLSLVSAEHAGLSTKLLDDGFCAQITLPYRRVGQRRGFVQ